MPSSLRLRSSIPRVRIFLCAWNYPTKPWKYSPANAISSTICFFRAAAIVPLLWCQSCCPFSTNPLTTSWPATSARSSAQSPNESHPSTINTTPYSQRGCLGRRTKNSRMRAPFSNLQIIYIRWPPSTTSWSGWCLAAKALLKSRARRERWRIKWWSILEGELKESFCSSLLLWLTTIVWRDNVWTMSLPSSSRCWPKLRKATRSLHHSASNPCPLSSTPTKWQPTTSSSTNSSSI